MCARSLQLVVLKQPTAAFGKTIKRSLLHSAAYVVQVTTDVPSHSANENNIKRVHNANGKKVVRFHSQCFRIESFAFSLSTNLPRALPFVQPHMKV